MNGVLWFLAGYLAVGAAWAIAGLLRGAYSGMRRIPAAVLFVVVTTLWGPILAKGLLTGNLVAFVRDQTRDE